MVAAVAKTDLRVDEYIEAQSKPAQRVLRQVRSTIRKALPNGEEVISYKIPAYRLNGKIVIYFAGWAAYVSMYPANERLVAAFKDELEPYRAGKGTLRFPLDEPVPVKLIERIVQFRAKELTEAKTTKKPK